MMPRETLEQTLFWGKFRLKVLGKLEARASAERLLEEVLGCDRLRLHLDSRQPVPSVKLKKYRRLIARRRKRIPVDYLLRRSHFWNEALEVSPSCLIPRPSTEGLVERFLEKSGFKKESRFDFLDLGCGSGAIGIALLRHYPNARATFSDISQKALAMTRKNLKRYDLVKRARTVASNLFEKFSRRDPRQKRSGTAETRWDAILCNPPYLSAADLKSAQPEVRREPRVALDGGRDGLELYHTLIKQAPAYLKKGGLLVLEMGKGQSRTVKKECAKFFSSIEIFKDDLGIDRVLIAKS